MPPIPKYNESIMKTYLVRHTQAVPSSEDPERPLTPLGKDTATAVGKFLNKHLKPNISHFYHSHKARAQETTKCIVSQLEVSGPIQEVDGLQPMDKPKIWKINLQTLEKDVMLVGHLPYLNNLARLLLEPSGNYKEIDFGYGTCVILERYSPEHWVIDYEFTPDL